MFSCLTCHFCTELTIENNQFLKFQSLISFLYLIIKQCFSEYSCKLCIHTFAWRVSWKHTFKVNIILIIPSLTRLTSTPPPLIFYSIIKLNIKNRKFGIFKFFFVVWRLQLWIHKAAFNSFNSNLIVYIRLFLLSKKCYNYHFRKINKTI